MEIIVAGNTGLCYGVRRALSIVRRTCGSAAGPVRTLGDIVHNPRVVAD
ncbi:MAG: hydroxymethylbutenyl pyrophosphate reductase, partial [Candidatus Aminicenantes bacterium]|nr:hydroxymethylbutenyl pyrophosphate reductase [Candidatus Aminicenantes bacterium]